jgi:hypothetical protein
MHFHVVSIFFSNYGLYFLLQSGRRVFATFLKLRPFPSPPKRGKKHVADSVFICWLDNPLFAIQAGGRKMFWLFCFQSSVSWGGHEK